jgi:glyoxylase-like metal-dependent hydrolase (beta-lactamase superfamily II)
MADAPSPPLRFDTTFDAQHGVPVSILPGVVRITAPNSGPFTFTGTNTYVLGDKTVAIVDPGPMNIPHLKALMRYLEGRTVEAVILTHTHRDHSDLVHELGEKFEVKLWCGGQHRPSRPKRAFETDWVARDSDYGLVPDRVLRDGEEITAGGVRLQVIATPGHCSNHLCFGVVGTPWMLSGDHVMGWNSTMIAVPDGSMADYFGSLQKLFALPYQRYLPGHGGPIADGPDYARRLLAHRQMRNEQVVQAVQDGARTVGELLAKIYPKLAVNLVPAARMTLRAHIEYLDDNKRIRVQRGLFGTVLTPA